MTFQALKCPYLLLILMHSNILKFYIFFSIILLIIDNVFFAESQLNVSFFQLFEHMFDMHENKLSDILDPDARKTEQMKRMHYNLIAYFTLLKVSLLSQIKLYIVWFITWLTQILFLVLITLFFILNYIWNFDFYLYNKIQVKI